MHKYLRAFISSAVFTGSLALSGCALSGDGGVSPIAPSSNVAVHLGGSVHGGQQPIAGAYIQLYAVGAGAYGAGAYPLIKTAATTDGSIQSTVQTDSFGNFSLTGLYNCPSANTQVYLTGVGGNPGAGINKQSALMAALGPCGSLSASTYINVNEVTTVAAVWSLQGFIGYSATGSQASLYSNGGSNNGLGSTTPAMGFAIGSSVTNSAGLSNAFSVSSILANYTTGASPGNNTSGNITSVEYGTVNLVANILAACINSTGGASGDSSNCGNLFSYATPSSGTAPQDTLQAAYLIAHNPSNNVTNLAGLAGASAPFMPAATVFNDFTIAYNVGNANSVSSYNTTFASPYNVTFDSYGNAWVYNLDILGTSGTTATAPYAPFISELDPAGNLLTKVGQYYNTSGVATNINSPNTSTPLGNGHPPHLVIDSNNTLYAEDHQSGYLFAINGSTGAGVASPGVFTLNAIATGVAATSGSSWGSGIQNLALDGQGALWFNTGTVGAAPFSTTSGSIESLATSSFASGTASGITTGATVGSNTYGLAIDNTAAGAVNGAPFVWGSNISNCTGNIAALGSTGAYGNIYPVNGLTAGTATKGAQASFKAVTDLGVSTTSCSTTSYPTMLATVTTSYNGTSYQAAPIAQPTVLNFDSSNNLWLVNQYDAAAATGTGAGQFSQVPDMSVTHMTVSYSPSFSITNVAQSTGGGIAAGAQVGGVNSLASFQGAIDGAGNFWAVSGGGAYVSEFSYNSTSGIVPLSPSTGFIGSTCNSCLASVGTTARKVGTRKAISIDRSGNVWSPNAASNGNWITVIVGAATPAATPALPSTQGTRP